MDSVVQYLDYVNKVRYSDDEINEVLSNLSASNKITEAEWIMVRRKQLNSNRLLLLN